MGLTIWNESTRGELNDILPESVVVLPTGATEQHGPHLVTGHDAMMVTTVALQAADRASSECNVVLAPTLPFGSSQHHLSFGGTLSLSTETYYRVVRELVESIVSAGARMIFLLNGHGGNHELNQLVARDAAVALRSERAVAFAAASYWDVARQSIISDPRVSDLTLPGHAGEFETATMLATNVYHVRERASRRSDPSATDVIPGVRVESAGRWERFDGYTDFPHRATAEQGEILLEHLVNEVAAALVAYSRRSPTEHASQDWSTP